VSRSTFALALLGCVAFGAALRAHDLEGALVWHDEVFTQVFAAGHGASDWLPLFDSEVRPITELRAARVHDPSRSPLDTARMLASDEPQHPPLYYVAARAFMAAAGEGADVTTAAQKLRWLSWFFSILAILSMGWCARELFRVSSSGRKRGLARSHGATEVTEGEEEREEELAESEVGSRESESESVGPRVLAAVALFVVSPFHVFYAQEAREYALWTAFVLASTAALLRARRMGSRRAWLLYTLLLVAGFYTSFAMLTVAVGHALFVAARELPLRGSGDARGAILRAVAAWSLGALLFLPWALLLLEHWEAFQASMAWSSDITIPRSEILETFALNLSRPFVELGVDEVTAGVAIVGALVALAVVAGLRSLRAEARALLLALFVVPLCFYLLPDLVTGGIRSLSARYLIPSLLALQLAVAALAPGSRPLPKPRRRIHTLTLVTLLCLGALTSIGAARAVAPWTKGISRPLPPIVRVLEPHPDALIVVDHERHHPGTILTLSGMLPESTRVQLLPTVEDYVLADHDGPIFLLDVSPRFRNELRASAAVTITPVSEHLHATLYRVHLP